MASGLAQFSTHSVTANQLKKRTVVIQGVNLTTVAGSKADRRRFKPIVSRVTDSELLQPSYLDNGMKILSMVFRNLTEQAFVTTGKFKYNEVKSDKLFVCSGALLKSTEAFVTQCFVDVTQCGSNFADVNSDTFAEYIPESYPAPLFDVQGNRDINGSIDLTPKYKLPTVNMALIPTVSSQDTDVDLNQRFWYERDLVLYPNGKPNSAQNPNQNPGTQPSPPQSPNNAVPTGVPPFARRDSMSSPITKASAISDLGVTYRLQSTTDWGLAADQFYVNEKAGYNTTVDHVAESGDYASVTRVILPAKLSLVKPNSNNVTSYLRGTLSCYHQIVLCDTTIENGVAIQNENCIPAPFFCNPVNNVNCDLIKGIGLPLRTHTAVAAAILYASQIFGKPIATIKDIHMPDRYYNTTSKNNFTQYNFNAKDNGPTIQKQFEQAIGLLHFSWALSSVSLLYDPAGAAKSAVISYNPQNQSAEYTKAYNEAFNTEMTYVTNITVTINSKDPVDATAVDLTVLLIVFSGFLSTLLGAIIIAILNNTHWFKEAVKRRRQSWDPVQKYMKAKREHLESMTSQTKAKASDKALAEALENVSEITL
ncbi:hypothetical protein HDU97_001666 [Phlyctochytrium planicorne]|nr:hypothetical protein HDU97_001666 [Phlyctochytrium planicorne]